MKRETFIIADIGSNHRGSLKTALKQIERCAESGVDAVKFQYYSHEELYGIKDSTKEGKSLPKEWLSDLKACADDNKVKFMCTAFSVEGIQEIDPYVDIHKLASCEMKHVDMRQTLLNTGKQTIISNGASHVDEILELLNFCDEKNWKPWILECVAAYPANYMDYNLTNLPEYVNRLGRSGISDHTLSFNLIYPCIQFGGSVFEVHADCVHGQNTPDTPVSLNYVNLLNYCQIIKQCLLRHEEDLEKRPLPSEKSVITTHRRRLKITRPMISGEILKKGYNFGIFRSVVADPKARAPENWNLFEGKPVKTSKQPGEFLDIDDIR